MNKEILLSNVDKIHTTEMGINRIKKNLKLNEDDVVEYCKNKVLDKNCNIYKKGKNWYCEIDNIKLTINSYSYTIITAHLTKNKEKNMQEDSYKYIGKDVYVKVDRPMGSSHPNYPDHIYPINYGFIPNTISGDGKELDCYILGVDKPVEEYKGKCIAIIHRTNDNDDKLIIVPENKEFTDEEIRKFTNFQEKYYESIIIR